MIRMQKYWTDFDEENKTRPEVMPWDMFNQVKDELGYYARKCGMKFLSESCGVSRQNMLNYCTGKTEKIPYDIVMKARECYREQKDNKRKMYCIRRKIMKKLGRPLKGEKDGKADSSVARESK